ncbi:MAG: hypothetical protein OXU81_23710 [Gammaproteobacteria bacterium]|nr:hypothetical protein [Gammaproteobacteria bacterium]
MAVEPKGTYLIVERRLDTREGCVARALCKTAEGLVIAVCGISGLMENVEVVLHAEPPFKMTIGAHAMQRSRMARIDFWVPCDAVVRTELERNE